MRLLQVVVPKTYQELTSRRVLTTAWVEGEKLSQSTADDVGDLVNVGVISYLKQLLDTGFFHVRLFLLRLSRQWPCPMQHLRPSRESVAENSGFALCSSLFVLF